MPNVIVETPPKKYKVVFVKRVVETCSADNDFDMANRAELFRRTRYPDFEVEEFYVDGEKSCQQQ